MLTNRSEGSGDENAQPSIFLYFHSIIERAHRTLRTAAAPEIRIGQSGFSRREQLYCPEFNVVNKKSIEVRQLFSLETASNIQEKAFESSKLLIWRQRQATRT